MALQTVAQKLKLVETQSEVAALHDAADELGARLSQLSALLLSAATGGLANLNAEQRTAYMFAAARLSQDCEGIVRDMPLPSL